MNKNYLTFTALLMFVPGMLHAQGINIGSGTTLSLGSGTLTVTGNWNNEGTFDAGTSTVIFNGAGGNQTIHSVLPNAFHNLVINKSSGYVVLQDDIEVEGELNISGGNLDIGEQGITLGPASTLNESPGARITGTAGTVSVTTALNAPNDDNVSGLGLKLTSATNLGVSTIARGHISQTASGNTAILRYYDISAANTSGMNATLVITYDDGELNGLPESGLHIMRSTDHGTSFTVEDGIMDMDNNTATITGVNSFSRWTLGFSESPVLGNIEQSPIVFIEDNDWKPVTGSLRVRDADDIDIEWATVKITGTYVEGQDILGFDDTDEIVGVWDAASGILTLSGSSDIGSYQNALRNVKYKNVAKMPFEAGRTIRITVNDGTTASNISSRGIDIHNWTEPHLCILSPVGGDSWPPGSEQQITWDAEGMQVGRIELSMDNGETWSVITDYVNLRDGSYNWIVPEGFSTGCRVRITNIGASHYISYTSRGSFAINGDCPVTIIGEPVIRPAATGNYEMWLAIDADQSDIGNVRFLPYIIAGDEDCSAEEWYGTLDNDDIAGIDMLDTGVSTVPAGRVNVPSPLNTFTFGISGMYIGGSFYQIKSETEATAAVELLEPNAFETLIPGDIREITWKADLLRLGRIELSLDGGTSWQSIADEVDLCAGSFSWTVPAGTSHDCLVRITSTEIPAFSDTSEQLFCIEGNCPVTVTGINGFRQVAPERYEMLFDVEASGPESLRNVRIISYANFGELPAQVDEWYADRDGDDIAGIDQLSIGENIVTAGMFDLPASVDEVTVGIAGLYVDGAYYDSEVEYVAGTACEPPTNITAVNKSMDTRRIELSWELSPNDTDVLEYRIYRSSGKSGTPAIDISTLTNPDAIIAAELSSTLYLGNVSNGIRSFIDPTPADTFISHYYWVEAVTAFRTSARIFTELPPDNVSVDHEPLAFFVSQPYPNPFNPETTIDFTIPDECDVTLNIYDISGRRVTSMHQGRLTAGRHHITWDAKDVNTNLVASGVYLYRLIAGGRHCQGKVLYMR